MIRALTNAASGMKAQEANIDVLSNNLANVNTAGYKRSRAEFADLFYEQRKRAGAPSPDGSALPSGLEIGYGTRTVATYKDFTGGEMRETGNPLDLAIEGRGFFEVMQPDGNVAYTRSGIFKPNADGQIVNVDGYQIEPAVSIPEDATTVTVSENGVVSVTLGNDPEQVEVGRLQVATFANPAGLMAMGRNLYSESPASGKPQLVTPGEEGSGRVMAGFVESSNVAVVSEMIDLIAAQRAYEVNSKVIQAADEMLRETAKLG
ncbi:MAG: flagellar basal-body rod protein FlgG [Deltaproteobacteria bacterium]|nr:flagellar basal-body rod protein FlgG [Deltaproteobacteria bacterium]